MKISKNFLLIALMTLAVLSSVISCKKEKDVVDLVGNWLVMADFAGDARTEAVAFAIGETGYVGTGFNGDDRLNDFWAYNTTTNNWSIIATDTALSPRINAVAFSSGGKGYVGTGRDDNSILKDFWSYDPGLNKWSRVADIPAARYGGVAFSIGNTGYVGTGYNGSALLDFYSYDPSANQWTPISNYPSKVTEAVAFVLNDKGYVCTGIKNNDAINEFYMYDPEPKTWVSKRKIANVSDEAYDDDYSIIRQKAVAFTIGGRAYIVAGETSGVKNDVWEYDPATDLWMAKTNFEGAARNNAVAFTTASGRGYVTTGTNGGTSFFDDLFEFKPLDDYNEDD